MANPPILDEMWAILGPVDIKDFEVVAGAAEAERFDAYEARLGFKLPDAFRDLSLSKLGGVYVTAREEHWPEAKLYDVGPAWTFWRGVMVFGLAPDVPDWLNLEVMLDRVREQEISDFAPVLKVEGDSRLYGFRPDQTVAVFDGYELEDESAESFAALYRREIGDLLERFADMKALQAKRARKG
ncbi:MAG: SMI1/KNR4 family protein [Bordetella sp.]|nr:SMI1/KNR4 family protein [Bordetella sp.]